MSDAGLRAALWGGLSLRRKQVVWAWTFLSVPILFYGLIRFYPTFEGLYLSTTNWNLLTKPSFVGLANFQRMWADPVFWQVFRNTILYVAIGMPVSMLLAFTIAYHLDRVRFMHGFIRALYFLPFLTTAAAMAWVWRWFYQPLPIGLINDVLSSFVIPQQPFLRSTTQALPAVLVPAIWAALGFKIVIFMAGLRAIPTTYYEAARIDGVSNLTILWRITIPLLKPTIIFLVVFSSIGFLRIFDMVYNMNSLDLGGPLNSTKPLVLMIYQTAFSSFEMGYAAALTVVLFVVLLSLSLAQLRLLKDK